MFVCLFFPFYRFRCRSSVNNTETTELADIPALHFSHTHNFRLLLCHFFFGNELLVSSLFLILFWQIGVSQELFNEFRTIQIVLRFPCVFCTVKYVRGRREHTLVSCKNNKLHKQICDFATPHSLGEAFPLQKVLHSSIRDPPANDFFHHKLLDNCGLLSLPLFGSLLLSHPDMEKEEANEWQAAYITVRPFAGRMKT